MTTQARYPLARILIVDDQDANLRLLERILRQGGYTCWRSQNDPRQVVADYHAFQPDLVLLDLMMPHLDGVAVTEQLRTLRPAGQKGDCPLEEGGQSPFCPAGLTEGACLPIVILTADVSDGARRRALAAGASDFLTKPVDAIEVLLRIHNLLETRFLYQELQQRADRRIREQAALLDRANDAILVEDLDDRIEYWNEGATKLYGWTAAEAIGQNAFQLLYEGPTAERHEAGERSLKEGKWEGELRQVRRDRRPVTVASRWTLVADEQGRPKSRLIINTDITQKKALEAQLVQAQRMEAVGVLAGGVAHDFNNLLTIILGYSEAALGALDRKAPVDEALREIRNASLRAAALTRQLLAFSRKQLLTPTVLNLNTLVTEAQKMLSRLIGEDIELTAVLDPALGCIKADAGQLEQVLMNLVVNARDAMPTGGRLMIETCNIELDAEHGHNHPGVQPGPFVLLTVRDTGCGMDEATRTRIFEPFFTTKGPGKGTGLGLATVHGIVCQSGGSIEVVSEPGQGTIFKIYLPRLPESAMLASETDSPSPLSTHGTGTVLLVEDEEAVRSLMARALRSAGFSVLEAPDGEEALGICQADPQPLDLIVTDVVMPRMNGRQLADRLTVLRPGTKVLYMSGYTDDTIMRYGIQDAEAAFLQKPVTRSVLIRKINEMLERHTNFSGKTS